MTDILLIFSFILNGIALYCIVNLYLRQNRFLEIEKKHEKMLTELDEVVSAFMLEMNEENEKFLKKIQQIVAEKEKIAPIQQKTELELKKAHVNGQDHINKEQISLPVKNREEKPPILRRGNHYQAVAAYKTMTTNEKAEEKQGAEKQQEEAVQHEEQPKLTQLSAYEQAIQLKKAGLSIEEIAKKLHKGKTEIELLLKFEQMGD